VNITRCKPVCYIELPRINVGLWYSNLTISKKKSLKLISSEKIVFNILLFSLDFLKLLNALFTQSCYTICPTWSEWNIQVQDCSVFKGTKIRNTTSLTIDNLVLYWGIQAIGMSFAIFYMSLSLSHSVWTYRLHGCVRACMCVYVRNPRAPEHLFHIPHPNPHIGKARCFNRLVYVGYMCASMCVYRRIREGGGREVGYFPNGACFSQCMF
jgi:hypothetical protein